MKNKIISFSESIKEKQSLETPYTVGDLKNFIKDLPDNMSVTLMNDDNEPFFNYIKVVNSSKLDMVNPITGEYFDTLLINFDE